MVCGIWPEAVETIAFVMLAGEIGAFPTIFLCALTSFCGLWLVRTQGFETILRLMQSGRLDPHDLKDGFFLLIAGMLFLFPGFVSDTAGFIVLMPPVRSQLFRRYAANVQAKAQAAPDSVIEGVYEVMPDENHRIDRQP